MGERGVDLAPAGETLSVDDNTQGELGASAVVEQHGLESRRHPGFAVSPRRVFEKVCRKRLRFPPPEEAAFLEDMQPEIVVSLVACASFAFVRAAIPVIPVFLAEARRKDHPFVMSENGPRTVHFLGMFAYLMSLSIAILMCLLRLFFGRALRFNFEWLAILVCVETLVLTFLCGRVSTSRMFGQHSRDVWSGDFDVVGVEMVSALTVACVVVVACQAIPIRSHLMWVVPLSGALHYPAYILAWGTSMRTEAINVWLCLALTCVFSHAGAVRNEVQRRTKWRAVREAAERDQVARGLQAISWMSCDITARLDQNLRILDANSQLDAFFGQSMHGRRLSEIVDEGDIETYQTAVQRAVDTSEVQSMPAKFETKFALLQAQVAVVCVPGVSTRFIVGISQVGTTPKAEATAFVLSETAGLGSVNAAPSLCPTAATEKLFHEIDRLCSRHADTMTVSVRDALQAVVRIGRREHWLLHTDDLEIVRPPAYLGSGSYGSVVWGRLRGTPVAIKVPRADGHMDNARLVSSFCNEIRLFRRVRHPNIVAFHGAVIDPDSCDLAMVFDAIDGHTMTDFVGMVHRRSSKRKNFELAKVLLDVSCALRYLHMADPAIVHGDLKSSNILVGVYGTPIPKATLLDFGLSRLLSPSAQPLGGTPDWSAPELRGRPPPSASADVYSFGLLAHFTTTGVPPRVSYDAADKYGRCDRLSWPEGAPFREECKPLSLSCMSSEPGARPAMSQVHDAVADWMMRSGRPFERMGKSVICQLVTTSTWEEGLRTIKEPTLNAPPPKKPAQGRPGKKFVPEEEECQVPEQPPETKTEEVDAEARKRGFRLRL